MKSSRSSRAAGKQRGQVDSPEEVHNRLQLVVERIVKLVSNDQVPSSLHQDLRKDLVRELLKEKRTLQERLKGDPEEHEAFIQCFSRAQQELMELLRSNRPLTGNAAESGLLRVLSELNAQVWERFVACKHEENQELHQLNQELVQKLHRLQHKSDQTPQLERSQEMVRLLERELKDTLAQLRVARQGVAAEETLMKLEALELEREEQCSRNQQLQQKVQELYKLLRASEEEADTLKDEAEERENNLAQYLSDLDTARKELEQALHSQELQEETQRENEELSSLVRDLEEAKHAYADQIEELEQQLVSREIAEAEVRDSFDSLSQRLNQAQLTNKDLEQALQAACSAKEESEQFAVAAQTQLRASRKKLQEALQEAVDTKESLACSLEQAVIDKERLEAQMSLLKQRLKVVLEDACRSVRSTKAQDEELLPEITQGMEDLAIFSESFSQLSMKYNELMAQVPSIYRSFEEKEALLREQTEYYSEKLAKHKGKAKKYKAKYKQTKHRAKELDEELTELSAAYDDLKITKNHKKKDQIEALLQECAEQKTRERLLTTELEECNRECQLLKHDLESTQIGTYALFKENILRLESYLSQMWDSIEYRFSEESNKLLKLSKSAHRKLQNSLAQIQIERSTVTVLKQQIQEQTATIENYQRSVDSLKASLDSQDHAADQEELSQLQAQVEALTRECWEHKTREEKIQAELADSAEQCRLLNEHITTTEDAELNKLKFIKEQALSMDTLLSQKCLAIEEQLASVTGKLGQVQRTVKEKPQTATSEAQTDLLDIAVLERALEERATAIQCHKQNVDLLSSQLERAQEHCSELESTNTRLEAQLHASQALDQTSGEDLDHLKGKIEALTGECWELRSREEVLRAELEAYEEECRLLKQYLATTENAEVCELTEIKANVESFDSLLSQTLTTIEQRCSSLQEKQDNIFTRARLTVLKNSSGVQTDQLDVGALEDRVQEQAQTMKVQEEKSSLMKTRLEHQQKKISEILRTHKELKDSTVQAMREQCQAIRNEVNAFLLEAISSFNKAQNLLTKTAVDASYILCKTVNFEGNSWALMKSESNEFVWEKTEELESFHTIPEADEDMLVSKINALSASLAERQQAYEELHHKLQQEFEETAGYYKGICTYIQTHLPSELQHEPLDQAVEALLQRCSPTPLAEESLHGISIIVDKSHDSCSDPSYVSERSQASSMRADPTLLAEFDEERTDLEHQLYLQSQQLHLLKLQIRETDKRGGAPEGTIVEHLKLNLLKLLPLLPQLSRDGEVILRIVMNMVGVPEEEIERASTSRPSPKKKSSFKSFFSKNKQ